MNRREWLWGAAALPLFATVLARAAPTEAGLEAAAAYSAEHQGLSMLVMQDGRTVFERYTRPAVKEAGWELASGTKSFCGVMAAALVADGLLDLDEPAVRTLPEWRTDGRAAITVRQVLNLTSGVRTEDVRGRLATYADAVSLPLDTAPGARFRYGGNPFQVFGEIVRRKLTRDADPLAYLDRRVLKPAGVDFRFWRLGADGMPHLASGARVNAGSWARFGELVRLGGQGLVDPAALEACFQGSDASPAYGLSWWLARPVAPSAARSIPQLRSAGLERPNDVFPQDLVLAAGAGKQRLYVSRAERLVVVRQAAGIRDALEGARAGFDDVEFWRRLRS